jgi:hypothetical protein
VVETPTQIQLRSSTAEGAPVLQLLIVFGTSHQIQGATGTCPAGSALLMIAGWHSE